MLRGLEPVPGRWGPPGPLPAGGPPSYHMGDHASDEESTESQPNNVDYLDLHRHDSIEYIDASSEEEPEFKTSSSTKRYKTQDKMMTPGEESTESNIKFSMAMKEKGEEKNEGIMQEDNKNKMNITSATMENKTFAIKTVQKENKHIVRNFPLFFPFPINMKKLENDSHTDYNSRRDGSHNVKQQHDGEAGFCLEAKLVMNFFFLKLFNYFVQGAFIKKFSLSRSSSHRTITGGN